MPWKLAVRDLLLLAATGLLWLADTRLRGSEEGSSMVLAMVTGAMTALCGYLVHEWGHLAGARLGGGVVHPADRATSVFLFRFDSDRNDRARFLWMSSGGFAASAVAVVLLLATLPLDATSGRVALGLVVMGVLATFVLEVPVAWRVARGAPLPRGAAYTSSSG